MNGFHGAFATGVACQQGTLTLPDTWFRPPLGDLLVLQLLRPDPSSLPCLYSTFRLEYPLVLSRFCFVHRQCVSSSKMHASLVRPILVILACCIRSIVVLNCLIVEEFCYFIWIWIQTIGFLVKLSNVLHWDKGH